MVSTRHTRSFTRTLPGHPPTGDIGGDATDTTGDPPTDDDDDDDIGDDIGDDARCVGDREVGRAAC